MMIATGKQLGKIRRQVFQVAPGGKRGTRFKLMRIDVEIERIGAR